MGRLEDLREGLDAAVERARARVGTMMVDRIQGAFRTQGRGPHRWSARKVPWLAGVIRDMEVGTTIRPRRFRGRPALVGDDNEPMASIAWRPVGADSLEVGSRQPYASDYHRPRGGEEKRLAVSAAVKRNLGEYLRRNKKRARTLGWIMGKESVIIRTARRPFVIFLPEDRTRATAIFAEEAAK